MSFDFVDDFKIFLKIYEKDLPTSLKQIVGIDTHTYDDDSVLACLSNVFNNPTMDDTEFINTGEDITIIPRYISHDYADVENVETVDDFRYITTSNVLIKDHYITTLNTLFDLIQTTELSQHHLPLYNDYICNDISYHIGTLANNEDKPIILHILHNFFKMLFVTVNAHIFNAIALRDPAFDYRGDASYCLTINLIELRTKFNLNANTFEVTSIKVEDQNTISLKSTKEETNYYYNKIVKNNFVLKIENKEYTIMNNFDITANNEFIVKVDTSRVKNTDKDEYEIYHLTSHSTSELHDITIEYKTTNDYKSDFNNNKENIILLNDNLNKQYDKYQKNKNFITYFESLYSKIDIITILFYIIFAIILFLVLFVDLSLNVRIFSSLIGIGVVVMFYVITIAMYDFKEHFESNSEINDYQMYQEVLRVKNADFYNTLKITTDMVSMRSMHRDSMRAMDLDKVKLDKGNALYENNTKNTSNILNDKKHNLLLYTLRITLITYLSIILLVFNILYSIHPEYNILIITLTSIAIIYIIFYYMYNINKSVRSNYVNKYYPEVSNINNF
jgi:hypothetical protein